VASLLAVIEIEEIREVRVIRVSGEIDASNAEELGSCAGGAIEDGGAGVVVDLSELSFLDSTGIQMLLTTGSRLAESGGKLRVVVTPGSLVARLLESTGVDRILAVDGSVEDAIAAQPPA
jgi:anti-sigma B factor antagonist